MYKKFESQQEAAKAGLQNLYDLARRQMWFRIDMKPPRGTANLFQPIEEDYKAAVKLGPLNNFDVVDLSILDRDCCVTVQEKENTMYAEATSKINLDSSKSYVERRLRSINENKYNEIEAEFAPIYPKTPKELKEWIKSGNFRIEARFKDEEYEEGKHYFWWAESLRWGKEPIDEKAKEKAFKDLSEAYRAAQDVVNVKTDEDARLKALKEFESWTIH